MEGLAAHAAPSPYDDAELYDLLFSGFAVDLDFWLAAAKGARGPALEVGCGTGRVLLHCMQAGVEVDGVDLYPSMLDVLKRKAGALGLKPRVYAADMRDFTTPRKYGLIMITFNAFAHALTTEDQLKTLRVCREHLEPGGALALTTLCLSYEEVIRPDGERVREGEFPSPKTGLTLRLWDTRRKDRVNQIQCSRVEVEELDAAGAVTKTHTSETTVRWTYPAEMGLLLRVAGFARWEISGDYDGRPLANQDDQMIVRAWRG
jgi:SAM-dependent methyltransferase